MLDGKDVDLRDWFAGVALMGLLSRPPEKPSSQITHAEDPAFSLAIRAYQYAEAMLKVRARETDAPSTDAAR